MGHGWHEEYEIIGQQFCLLDHIDWFHSYFFSLVFVRFLAHRTDFIFGGIKVTIIFLESLLILGYYFVDYRLSLGERNL